MKAAIYARYSTDQQREASIADQYRNCERHAQREGWTMGERYEDKAISGTSKDRPGYQQMLADAKAKQFDVLLVDDLSRLSRDEVEMKQVIRRFKFHGIRVIGVSDGFDSDSKGHKIQATVRGMMNEIYLDDLAEKTHRGLTGQALKGYNTGGRAYGYRHVPIEDATRKDNLGRPIIIGVKREKDPTQAKIVTDIFQLYADGHSPRAIADELNRRRLPSPGASWKRTVRRCKGWLGSAITPILQNPLYAGTYIWNRSEWEKDPDTGKMKSRPRPESEWLVKDMPELRIIPPELWDRVQARLQQVRVDSKAIQEALHKNARTGRGPKYLFSGLLKCAKCGASFVMISATHYGCGSYTNGGKHACGNTQTVPRALVEAQLLDGIRKNLFDAEAIERLRKRIVEMQAERKKAKRPDLEKARQQLAQIEKKVGNLVAAIEDGAYTPALKVKLEQAEQERQRLAALLKVDTRETDKIVQFLPGLIEEYREIVEGFTVGERDIARARADLKTLLAGQVLLHPTEQGLEAEMAGDYAGLIKLASGRKINVVAGVGFEPTTFGL